MSDETTATPEKKKKKNRPRHITMMEREYDRVAEKFEQTAAELANVSRARAALSGGACTDETIIASCAEHVTQALADQKDAAASGAEPDAS